jgi:hypothetical protein
MQAGGMTMGRRGACAGGTGSVGLGHPGGGSKKQAASHSAVRMLGVPKRELRESRACAASDAAAVHMARAASGAAAGRVPRAPSRGPAQGDAGCIVPLIAG